MDRVLVVGDEGKSSLPAQPGAPLEPTGSLNHLLSLSLSLSLGSTMPANPSPTHHPATGLQLPRPMAAAGGVARRLDDLPICFPGLHLRLTRLQQEPPRAARRTSHLHAAIPALHMVCSPENSTSSSILCNGYRESNRWGQQSLLPLIPWSAKATGSNRITE